MRVRIVVLGLPCNNAVTRKINDLIHEKGGYGMAGAGVEKDLCRREVVVFDWDGTVADSVAQVVQAIRKRRSLWG